MSGQVKAFIPIDITDARFVSSTIAEPDAAEPAWNSGVTYAEFALVSVIAANSHLVYESLVSGNLNNPPATSPTKWLLKGYTNRYRMFDWNQGNPSGGTSPLTVVVRPSQRISAVMLEGMKAATAAITVQDGIGGPVALSISKNLNVRQTTTFYEWFFAPFIYDKVLSTFDVPPIADPVVTVTLTDPSGTCELARFATGIHTEIGEIEWDSASEGENYSEITWDQFGRATLLPIPSIPTLEMQLVVDANKINAVRQFKDLANAKAVVWSAMDQIDNYREMHTLIGVYQRFRITAENHKTAKINLTMKGV